MKKMICGILGLTIIAGGISAVIVSKEAQAGVSVEVNIGPPVMMVDEPSEVVFAPGYGVYFVPDLEFEMFFYNGFWWSRRGANWYRSRYYRSGWGIIRNQAVPRQILRVPRDYRKRFAHERHIRYQDFKVHRSQPQNGHGDNKKNTQQNGNQGQPAAGWREGGTNPNQGANQRQPEKVGRDDSEKAEQGGNRGGNRQNDNKGEGEHGRD